MLSAEMRICSGNGLMSCGRRSQSSVQELRITRIGLPEYDLVTRVSDASISVMRFL